MFQKDQKKLPLHTQPDEQHIIDISDEGCLLPSPEEKPGIIKSLLPVPIWPHKYIFGAYEIEYATPAQQEFYAFFKNEFRNNRCLDVEENTNYLFTLLFELLDDYKIHGDINTIEHQIKLMGDAYPVTRSYAISYLVKLLAEKESQRSELFDKAARQVIATRQASSQQLKSIFNLSDSETKQLLLELEEAGVIAQLSDGENATVLMTNIFQIQPEISEETEHRLIEDFPDFFWSLGQRYAQQLGLDKREKKILDQMRLYENNFNSIEVLRIEIFKLLLLGISDLDESYRTEGSSLTLQINEMGDLIARKHYRYRLNSRNHNAALRSAPNDVYSALFKICENEVREHYHHKRKVQIPPYCDHPQIVDTSGNNLFERFREVLHPFLSLLPPLDEVTENELNRRNPTRWKTVFSELAEQLEALEPSVFIRRVLQLGKENIKNPALENIYLEAFRTMTTKDPKSALILYLYYLECILDSGKEVYKPIPKNQHKLLFNDDSQQKEFEKIVDAFCNDRDLSAALHLTERIYLPKRKKIRIDASDIHQIQLHHAATVDLLNEYLGEEEEGVLPEQPITDHLPSLQSPQENKSTVSADQKGRYIVNLNEVQLQFIQLFTENNLKLDEQEANRFAKEHNCFLSQLIESVNDTCYDTLDDVLIEEEDATYTIAPDYFNLIKHHD